MTSCLDIVPYEHDYLFIHLFIHRYSIDNGSDVDCCVSLEIENRPSIWVDLTGGSEQLNDFDTFVEALEDHAEVVSVVHNAK